MEDRGDPAAGSAAAQGEKHSKLFTLGHPGQRRGTPRLPSEGGWRSLTARTARVSRPRTGYSSVLLWPWGSFKSRPPQHGPRGRPHVLRMQRREPNCPPQRPIALSPRGGPEPVPVPIGHGASRESRRLCGGALTGVPGREQGCRPRSERCGILGRELPGTGKPSQPHRALFRPRTVFSRSPECPFSPLLSKLAVSCPAVPFFAHQNPPVPSVLRSRVLRRPPAPRLPGFRYLLPHIPVPRRPLPCGSQFPVPPALHFGAVPSALSAAPVSPALP